MARNLFMQAGTKLLSRAYRLYDWTRHSWGAGFGDDPRVPGWKNFLRGAALGAASTAALATVPQALAEEMPDYGGTDVVQALAKAFSPITKGMCWVYNQAGLAVFVAAGIAVVIGFILKAFQARSWGLFVWGGIIAAAGTGIVLALISTFGNPKKNCSALTGGSQQNP